MFNGLEKAPNLIWDSWKYIQNDRIGDAENDR